MAVGVFVIQERPDLGGFQPRGGAARFEWDSDHRNAPFQPWPGGVTQRTARTDYTGADSPTEQVLGPNFKPFTLRGQWLDKYNPLTSRAPGESDASFAARARGYAIKEWKAFTAMVRRGNMLEFSFKSMTFFGIITDYDWEYRREYDIGYSFTVSVHRRPGADELDALPSPSLTRDANTLSKEIEQRITARMDILNAAKPSRFMAGDLSPTTEAEYQALKDASTEFNTVVSQRVLQVAADAFLSVRRAVAAGDIVIGRAQSLINTLGGVRSDVDLMYQTALGVLDVETWGRGLAAQGRLVVYDSYNARQQLDEQIEPNAIALYRPFKGESLYSISNRFYNTPHNWRLIKQRNRLGSSALTGTELLVIPEAPPQ